MARDIVFVPNEEGIRSLYTGNTSPVVTHLRKKAGQVERMAKIMVGKGTGRLAASIKTLPTMYSPLGAPYVMVGSRLDYALVHHEGSRPHLILPNSGGLLRFPSRNGQVFATVVKHPGTRANPYLTMPLRMVMARDS